MIKFNEREKLSFHAAVFIAGFTVIYLELFYPKLLQLTHLIHNAFEIITYALLGMGLGSFIIYIVKGKWKEILFHFLLLLLPVAIVISIVLLILYRHPIYSIFYLLLPFLFSGVIVAYCFRKYNIFSLYWSLLLGSASGGLIVLYLFPKIGGENTLLCSLMIISLISYYVFRGCKLKFYLFPIAFFLLNLILLLYNLESDNINIMRLMPISYRQYRFYGMSPMQYRALENSSAHALLKDPNVKLLDTRWNIISRVDLLEGPSELLALRPVKEYSASDKRDIAIYFDNIFLNKMVGNVKYIMPYTIYGKLFFKHPKVLIIGIGGGLDIRAVEPLSPSLIHVVEINPAMAELTLDAYNDYNNNIAEGVQLFILDGRNFVKYYGNYKYNLIILNFADTYCSYYPFSYIRVENYLYTLEAFKDYIVSLADNGIIYLAKWIQWSGFDKPFPLLRLFVTAYYALKDLAYQNPEKHLIAIETRHHAEQWASSAGYILIKKSPFEKGEIETLLSHLPRQNTKLLYAPGYKAEANEFSNFIFSTEKKVFLANYPYNLNPPDDLKPFFYNFGKKVTLPSHFKKLIVIFTFLIFFYFLSIFKKDFTKVKILIITIVLSIGYMILEISLMQRYNIFLGNPIYSLGLILFCFMFGGSWGSLLAFRLKEKKNLLRLFLILLLIAISLNIFCAKYLPFSYNVLIRSLILAIFLLPLVIPLGMPFPLIMSFSRKKWGDDFVALLWVISGIFSPLGSYLAIYLALYGGFNFCLSLSFLFYCFIIIMLMTLFR